MNRTFLIILFFFSLILLSCSFFRDVFRDIRTEFIERDIRQQYESESKYHSGVVTFGQSEGPDFNEMDTFTETGVLLIPIYAKVTLHSAIDAEKIRTTIYKVHEGSIYLQDRYTNNVDKDWPEFTISLPIYSPGFYKVDFEYEDGEVFASGTVEVFEDEE